MKLKKKQRSPPTDEPDQIKLKPFDKPKTLHTQNDAGSNGGSSINSNDLSKPGREPLQNMKLVKTDSKKAEYLQDADEEAGLTKLAGNFDAYVKWCNMIIAAF